jgi:hypothetical protein
MRTDRIWDLSTFSLLDMLRCSRGLRDCARNASTFDEAATAIVGYLYSQFADSETKTPQCAMIRLYKTAAYKDLSLDLQSFVRRKMGSIVPSAETRVLALISTVGIEPEWNDRTRSVAHKAIPLPSVEIVEQAPMIAGLIKALGFKIADIVSPSMEFLKDAHGKTHNVFHVPVALGSPLIPAQEEFVIPYGIKSIIGFGGILPTGELFALVMFSRVPVDADAAGRFKSVALDVKAILHPLAAEGVLTP